MVLKIQKDAIPPEIIGENPVSETWEKLFQLSH